jgi:8-oxo-dGTP diphosphatase
MSRYTPILGTLIYVLDPDQRTVLLVHRTARSDDEQFGKWNGLGGKVHADEGIVAGARRELLEEASIEPLDLVLRGTISWPGFGPNGEDWFGFVFLATQWTGVVPVENEEGTLHWVALSRVLAASSAHESERTSAGLDFYEGDRFFLPLVFDNEPKAFHGVMPYADGRPTSWTWDRL